ncbi:translation initiation factor IF-2 isoform X2 [Drosophila suzukii]
MFNNQATQHKQSQLLNPFSQDGRASSPKPTFSKDQYGKPLAGSLTEMRGQKANIHVMKEMLELCQIINSEGYDVKDEPTMRVIPFGELFNIYNYISDKVVGILLRARKHKLVDFEGEMLYQRRDDNVPVFLLKPIKEIRSEMDAKIEDIKRAASPAPPQSTSVLMDRSAHEQNLKSRTPSPAVGKSAKAKSASPSPAPKAAAPAPAPVQAPAPAPVEIKPAQTAQPEVPEAAPVAVIVTEAEAEAPPTEEAPVTVSEPQAEEAVVPVAPVAPAATEDVPTIVIEATAEFVRTVSVEQLAPSPPDATQSSPDEPQPTSTFA